MSRGRQERIRPAHHPMRDQACPLSGGLIDTLQSARDRTEGGERIVASLGAVVDGMGNNVEACLAEKANGARHVSGGGHEQPALSGFGLQMLQNWLEGGKNTGQAGARAARSARTIARWIAERYTRQGYCK